MRRPSYEQAHARLAPMVAAIARDFYAPGLTADDLAQEARIGLWKACRDYDPASPVPFEAFAHVCIKRQMITAVVTAKRGKHTPLNDGLSFDQEGGQGQPALADVFPDRGADPGMIAELTEELRELAVKLPLLTDVERTAVLHVANGGSYDDAPLPTRKAVDNALQRAKRKLAHPIAPAARHRRGVLLIDRSLHPSERDAIAAAQRVHPGCKVLELRKRKVRRGHVVAPQGRRAADGSLGRPVWAVEIETAV